MAASSPLSGVAAPLRKAIAACRPHFMAAAVFSALVNVLYLAPTLYMLLVYDRVMPTNGVETLALVSVVGLTAVSTLAFLEWIRSRLLVRSSARLERDLAGPVMTEVLGQASLSRTDRSQAMRQFDTFRQAVAGQAILAAFDTPWAPIYVLAAFLLHPVIGGMCVGAGALMLGLAWLNEKATHSPLTAANTAAGVAYAKQDHASAWASEVRALGMSRALVAKQLQERQEVVQLQTQASFAAAHYGGLIRFARLVLQSAALGVGAWLAIERQISAGSVIAASLLMTRALAPVEQVVGSWKSIIQARTAFEALNRLFAGAKPEDAHIRLPAPVGQVTLESVTVQTPTLDRVALNDIRLEIEAGHFVGVIGPSGAGKSTLLRVLAGAVAPKSGVVRIDGAAMTDWEPERLAQHVGFLPQDFLLFSGTIKDNISRFRAWLGEDPEALDAETIRAAQAAGAHEMILRLPQGYATRVGLGGAGLSAGQTQRIALARALFGRPKIVILDEPNAHLDGEGEQQLVETLTQLKKDGVTIIVAAHRGAVLSVADRLALIQNGQLAHYGQLNDVLSAMRAPPAHAPTNVQAMRA
ncbi:type I secretion system permease/ATPase [Phenylobacterium montanum]|uniref:Type I secretion system permease/ATPase n=1 Tax=Phenylobacterium montanum TaxID=2823693 RepID=A0A975FW48_9CAUL|nr:type I secretion system permease/ATPase [Caulobacter sp. S6]QUD86480.1 type I secretion system permease/ATPase [Caulobacter sp. S6]